MLDKSIAYKNIIMRIEASKISKINQQILPEGFSFRFFEPGDEVHWARIEASVLEFNSIDEAKKYFVQSYFVFQSDLKKRSIFVINPNGLPIATATAWFANSEIGYQPSLHWVAVCPEYQGLGIGKAIVKQVLCVFSELEPNQAVWLHTQTWSYKAVMLYHNIGFNILQIGKIANNNTRNGISKIYPNDYDEAIAVLTKVLSEEEIQRLIITSR